MAAILAPNMALIEVVCRCGWTIRGREREVIAGIRAHARAEHRVSMSAGDVKAIWRLVDEAQASTDASSN